MGAALYGMLRVYWQAGHMPEALSPVDGDLMVFTGWSSAGLCGAAAVVSGLLWASPKAVTVGLPRRGLLAAGWAVSAALVASAALFLLDVVGGILPGLGVRFYPLGALSRAACLGVAVLVGLATLAHQRRTRDGCAVCGRGDNAPAALGHTPRWVFAAAYLAVAGCALRLVAQACVGFGENPMTGGVSAVLFEAGFVLAGTVLPLALAHGWGRVWPRWVPLAAGRRVPRPLVLWPAAGISGGMVVYFGLMLVLMVGERLQGRNPFPPSGGLVLPEAFFWVAVPSYLLWGVAMAVAAAGYARRTRTACRSCGR
ncbi:hypothetical protein [Actinomadura miaoliensis]|uniref:Polysulfide reductase n=1 Tax=Actinomadura miaoliensis TaxID=430685 RepID=A0ABP7V9Y5_9ACTN